MVTQAARAGVAPRAIRAFNHQTYPRRELVIVSVDDRAELLALVQGPARAGFWRAPVGSTLGDLRNVALAHASGELVATWDDDDWSHPERLTRQLAALAASDAAACVLARCTFAREAQREYALVRAWPRTGHASMVARRAAMPPYPPLPRKEDHVLYTLKVVAIDEPGLYVRTLHPGNTSDGAYALQLMRRRTSRPLPAAEVARLEVAMNGEAPGTAPAPGVRGLRP
jgi:glycosyltransferase involved in cell wall biosynthesis